MIFGHLSNPIKKNYPFALPNVSGRSLYNDRLKEQARQFSENPDIYQKPIQNHGYTLGGFFSRTVNFRKK